MNYMWNVLSELTVQFLMVGLFNTYKLFWSAVINRHVLNLFT